MALLDEQTLSLLPFAVDPRRHVSAPFHVLFEAQSSRAVPSFVPKKLALLPLNNPDWLSVMT